MQLAWALAQLLLAPGAARTFVISRGADLYDPRPAPLLRLLRSRRVAHVFGPELVTKRAKRRARGRARCAARLERARAATA